MLSFFKLVGFLRRIGILNKRYLIPPCEIYQKNINLTLRENFSNKPIKSLRLYLKATVSNFKIWLRNEIEMSR
jgi:hypothetical protein